MISVYDWVEDIVEKQENAGYRCVHKASFPGLLKVGIIRLRFKNSSFLVD